MVEFADDKNKLVWFLQPNEAQFYLAVETLKYKPKPFGKSRSPFNPRRGHSPRISPAVSQRDLWLSTEKINGITRAGMLKRKKSSQMHTGVYVAYIRTCL